MKSTNVKRQNLLITMVIVSCMVFAAGITYAQQGQGNADGQPRQKADGQSRQHQMRGGGPLAGMIKALNLTEDQKPKVMEILKANRDKMQAFRKKNGDAMKQFHKDLRQAMENKDYAKLHQLVDQLKTIDADRPTLKDLAAELAPVLTDEQKATLDKEIAKIKEQGPRRHHHRGGDSQGHARQRKGQSRDSQVPANDQ